MLRSAASQIINKFLWNNTPKLFPHFINGLSINARKPHVNKVETTSSGQRCRTNFFQNNIDEDEKKHSELIMTLKRSVLATQREQYDKAEQLLHIALRLSQQQQNEQGVTYCYDLMANLAMNRLQLDKAEKLFVSVLQMLLSKGVKEDDLKVIHISLKLARIYHLRAEEDKAEMGYKWCLEKIQQQVNDSVDAQTLYGVVQDWYAQFLLDRGDVKESLKHLQGAYEICKQVTEQNSEQSILLLNDLGITSWRAGDLEGAHRFLKEAVSMSENVEDKSHVGVVYANYGLVFLEKGMMKEAEKYCKSALSLGKRYDNTESTEQANYCIDQIKQSVHK